MKKELFLAFALLSSTALLSGAAKISGFSAEAPLLKTNATSNSADDWEKETKEEIGAVVATISIDSDKNYALPPYLTTSAYAGFKIGAKDLKTAEQTLDYQLLDWDA